MWIQRIFIGLMFLVFCGCATEPFTKAKGDVGQFILLKAVSYGGLPTATNGLPVVTSHWRYSEDSGGTQIYLPSEDYSRVELFLNQAFEGKPQFGPKLSEDGKMRIHEYRMSSRGGGVQLSGHETEAIVLVVRPFAPKVKQPAAP
jgi:hypothetical protein